MDVLLTGEGIVALLTLALLEIVLGVDNIIFISIVSNKLPEAQQPKARILGLSMALIFRIALLLSITWIIGFTKPLFTVFEFSVSGRDLILLLGGLFLIAKSTSEIHHKLEGIEKKDEPTGKKVSMSRVIFQIILLDIIFSFDSILTAVGLTDQVIIMIVAVVIAMIIMMVASGSISNFISKHPTLEMLALSFLILIGFMLMLEALHMHVPKGFIYFAVAFSIGVEMLNMKLRKRAPVTLKKRITE